MSSNFARYSPIWMACCQDRRPKYSSRNRVFRSKSCVTFGNCATSPRTVHWVWPNLQPQCIWLCCDEIISRCRRYYRIVWCQVRIHLKLLNQRKRIYCIWTMINRTVQTTRRWILCQRQNHSPLHLCRHDIRQREVHPPRAHRIVRAVQHHRQTMSINRQLNRNRCRQRPQKIGSIRAAKSGQNSRSRQHRMCPVRDRNRSTSICSAPLKRSCPIHWYCIQCHCESHQSVPRIMKKMRHHQIDRQRIITANRIVCNTTAESLLYVMRTHPVRSKRHSIVSRSCKMICVQFSDLSPRKYQWKIISAQFRRRRNVNRWWLAATIQPTAALHRMWPPQQYCIVKKRYRRHHLPGKFHSSCFIIYTAFEYHFWHCVWLSGHTNMDAAVV